jgi:hypothetical protein
MVSTAISRHAFGRRQLGVRFEGIWHAGTLTPIARSGGSIPKLD